jgi:hypothetical protein
MREPVKPELLPLAAESGYSDEKPCYFFDYSTLSAKLQVNLSLGRELARDYR